MLTEKQLKSAVKRYNELMYELGYDHVTIGTVDAEKTESWNLRDMVAECDYTLSTYYEWGHVNGDLRYSDDAEDRKMWRAHTGKLRRFIDRYEPHTEGIKCAEGHYSKYD